MSMKRNGVIFLMIMVIMVTSCLRNDIRSVANSDQNVNNTAYSIDNQPSSNEYQSTIDGTSVSIDTNSIAIVNLDEGVERNGQLEVYSSQIIQFPENDCTYEYTSLSDAETGIADGRYGAYIIIPATFSESIVSINATPSPCNLDYVLSETVSEQASLIAGIYDLYINLNNRISYMYLANILSEFHSAQDNAVTVINNDILDYNAMLAVQPTDIASTLVLSETPIPSNNTPMLDVSGCWQTMSSTVNNINALYSNATSDINEDIDTINNANTALQESLSNVRTGLNDSNASINSVVHIPDISYAQQQEVLDSAMETMGLNDSLQYITDLEEDIDVLDECLEYSLENYISSFINDDNDSMSINASIEISDDEPSECVLTVGACSCNCSIEDGVISIDSLDLQDFVNGINNYYGNNESDSSSSSNYGINIQDINLVDADGNSIINESDSGSSPVTIRNLLDEMGYSIEQIDPQILDEQSALLYEVFASSLQGAVNDVNTQLVDVNAQIDSVRTEINTNIDNSITSLDTYSTVLRDNRLSFPSNIANEDLNNLANAVYYLQQAVNDNNSAYLNYASDLHEAEANNISLLRQNIMDAYNLSEQSVENGLSNAISVRNQTSAQNQLLMNDFIGMLPYTRLGSLENTATYQFIANPVTLNDASD